MEKAGKRNQLPRDLQNEPEAKKQTKQSLQESVSDNLISRIQEMSAVVSGITRQLDSLHQSGELTTGQLDPLRRAVSELEFTTSSCRGKVEHLLEDPDALGRWDELPEEVWVAVLSYLTPLQLCRIATVNSRFSRLVQDPSLWRQESDCI